MEENETVDAEPIASEELRRAMNEATRVEVSGGHTILYHGHVPAGTTLDNADSGLPSGGVIEPGGIPYVSDDPGPEIVFLPRNAQVYPNPGVTVAHITNNATFCRKCGKLKSLITWSGGGSNGVSIPYEFCQCPPEPYQPSNTFPTPESLRAFVDERVRIALDGEHSIVDTRQQRRVRQFDEDGTEWRGVLYRVSKEE